MIPLQKHWSNDSEFGNKDVTVTSTFSCLMVKNGQTCSKNLALFTPQGFYNMFGYFSTLGMNGEVVTCRHLSC